jgi:hypothetical protein
MSDPQCNWERYLQALQRFGSPDDVEKLLRKHGTPEDAAARHAEITEILETRRRWRWVFSLVKETSAWLVGVGTVIVMIYAGITFLHTIVRPAEKPPHAEEKPE